MTNAKEITAPLTSPLEGWGKDAPVDAILWPSFDDWWTAYAYKLDRAKCEKMWAKMTQKDRELAMSHTERYSASTYTDGRYPSRRHPSTYLFNRNWNDEALIIAPSPARNDPGAKVASAFDRLADLEGK